MAAKEKLIRDRVPQIIRAQGDEPIVRFADSGEYRKLLRAKLIEEAHEVATADDTHAPEELADVLEVVLALAADLGLDAGGLERLRSAKAVERGSFTERIVWCGNRGSAAVGVVAGARLHQRLTAPGPLTSRARLSRLGQEAQDAEDSERAAAGPQAPRADPGAVTPASPRKRD